MRQRARTILILTFGWLAILNAVLGGGATPVQSAETPTLRRKPASAKPKTATPTAAPKADVPEAPPKRSEVPPRQEETPAEPAPPPETTNGNLGNMEVTGQAKDKVMIEKVTPDIKVDVKDMVDSVTDKTEKLLELGRPIPSDEDFRRFDRIDSRQTARPWLPDLAEPPLISFKPAPAQTTVVTWRLEVTDDKGDVVHTITGKGNPVHEIIWDGFNREGKMIKVSSAYAFRFITVDEYKETHTTLGKAFTLRHLKYKDKKNLIVEIATSYLFRDDKINPDALPILERTLDVLREYSGYPFGLEFQTFDPESETVKARQKAVTGKIAADLLLAPDSIKYTYAPVQDRGDVLRFVIKLR